MAQERRATVFNLIYEYCQIFVYTFRLYLLNFISYVNEYYRNYFNDTKFSPHTQIFIGTSETIISNLMKTTK